MRQSDDLFSAKWRQRGVVRQAKSQRHPCILVLLLTCLFFTFYERFLDTTGYSSGLTTLGNHEQPSRYLQLVAFLPALAATSSRLLRL
jgi:hypothetical protein